MMVQPICVPYEDYNKLLKDSADKETVIQLLKTEFPDDTCQLIAIKTVLGIVEEEPEEEQEPSEELEQTTEENTDTPTE